MHGDEIWKSDGTEAGTVLVEDLRPGPAGSYPRALTNVAGILYFSAFDLDVGFELFRTDGPAGAVLVKDIRPGQDPSSGPFSSEPGRFTALGDRLFFFANDGTRGQELWTSDGTAGGTTLVRDIAPSDTVQYRETRLAFGDRLYFVADDAAHGVELWSSDGTATGTELVKDIRTDTLASNPSALTNVGDLVYFVADDGVHGPELWRTDGTTSGTILVRDIHAGPQGSLPNGGGSLTVFNGRLYFNACDADDRLRAVDQRRQRDRHGAGQGHCSRRSIRLPHASDALRQPTLFRRQRAALAEPTVRNRARRPFQMCRPASYSA